MSEPLLEIEDVTIKYGTTDGDLTAVSDASLTIETGEFFGLVGESGCGKTTLAHSIIGALDENGRVTSGRIKYRGEEIQSFSERQLNEKIRWKEVSYIPQNALDGLDPLQRIKEKAWEIADIHTDMGKGEAMDRLRELFTILGLQEDRIAAYPHELSGGMQQRAVIALALLLEPKLIIADEPTTALDVIMQDQVFEYLEEVQDEFDISIVLITHDISVVFESCHRMAILHAGQVAEVGGTTDVYDSPLHPYSIMLQDAFPDIRYPSQDLGVVEGYPPELYGDVNSCTFADRCPWAIEECHEAAPALEPTESDRSSDHVAACIRKDEDLNAEYARSKTAGDRAQATEVDNRE
jgi:peptide/nickel transport system ATP-binding protein